MFSNKLQTFTIIHIVLGQIVISRKIKNNAFVLNKRPVRLNIFLSDYCTRQDGLYL